MSTPAFPSRSRSTLSPRQPAEGRGLTRATTPHPNLPWSRYRTETKKRCQSSLSLSLSQVVALYPYEAQGSQELSLDEGTIVTIITKEDNVWWCGKLMDGKIGMFPANYVAPYQM